MNTYSNKEKFKYTEDNDFHLKLSSLIYSYDKNVLRQLE